MPELLRLDPEPWICEDFIRNGASFKPREGYEQNLARYEEEVERLIEQDRARDKKAGQ